MSNLSVLVACFAVGINGDVIDTDYRKVAENAVWMGSEDRASYRYCLDRLPDNFPYEVSPGTISIFSDGKVVFSFRAHVETVFVCWEGKLYVATLDFTSSGCEVVAYDLKTRKHLWKTRLRGLGPVKAERTTYENWVNIETDGKAVTVWGHESSGRYVEFLDVKTGKTVGHKIIRDE